MTDSGDRLQPARRGHVARVAATFVVVGGLLLSCSAPDDLQTDGESGPPTASARGQRADASRTPAALPEASQPRPTDLPTLAATGSAAVIARQLSAAMHSLRDPTSPVGEVRRAAQFHQLAVRRLAAASATFRRNVLARVGPAIEAMVRGEVRAAGSLGSLTAPAQRLPRWRIVAPPPPAQLVRHYRVAQRRTGVPWSYLAAIHLVETRMGRIRGTSSAGARGPMQFLPATWELYGAGGDINDSRDAILAAGRLLKAHGAPGDMAGALWHYNPSDHYVRAVTEHAENIESSPVAYRSYWHWRVLYRHRRGTFVLPVRYPEKRPVLLPDS
jgi:membrane-bound lytic murein transglycosylase B